MPERISLRPNAVPQAPPTGEVTIIEKVRDRMLNLEGMANETAVAALRFVDKMDGPAPHEAPGTQDKPEGLIPAINQMMASIEDSLATVMSTFAKY